MTVPAQQSTSQVRIHLRTQNPDIHLPDTGPILVSTEFRRYQLSTLVNRLLDTQQPIPLEFLINGQFLRTSLDEFLSRNGISGETTLSIEYLQALIPPLYATSYEHDDCVSSVDVLSASSHAASSLTHNQASTVPERILSGSYDGLLRIWNMSSEVVATGQAHTAAVKDVKFVDPSLIASASVDRTIRIWKYDDTKTGAVSLSPTLELYGHKSSIDNLVVHAPSSRILSASSDHTVGLWSTSKRESPAASETLLPTANKRRKVSDSKPVSQRGPLNLLKGHQGQVSDVCFDGKDPTVAYSSSWDHAVKTWDLTTGTCVDTRTTPHSLFSVCHLPEAGLIATGTANRSITLLDPRASATSITTMTLRGHTNAVVSLSPDPNSSHQFVSGSHDGTCRIWDIRSVSLEAGTNRVGESVYVIDRESAKGQPKTNAGEGLKVFGVCWDRDVGIVSGGEDKRVQINRSTQ
ncbi:microtubule-associated protein ytm1 [Neohortaea acidophila]|uniref:Ribosome biogenesis protein YTM1 n=1 Tax=Neohortaea acidophila TaxID=245834 RepID=A0A6A6PMR2_9PEZI|nr:microtubule-associated protein ytm1 [Neohortaea acidophila]KAF2480981.1 microtubule-associated protein ytm1 [Neohortaea acidophila]